MEIRHSRQFVASNINRRLDWTAAILLYLYCRKTSYSFLAADWIPDGACLSFSSWVKIRLTVPSCWTSATRRHWRMASTTASSSVTWTSFPWTTGISTTATTSRDTSPSRWTSLASGELMTSNFGTSLSHSKKVFDSWTGDALQVLWHPPTYNVYVTVNTSLAGLVLKVDRV